MSTLLELHNFLVNRLKELEIKFKITYRSKKDYDYIFIEIKKKYIGKITYEYNTYNIFENLVYKNHIDNIDEIYDYIISKLK